MGVKIKNIQNHHLVIVDFVTLWYQIIVKTATAPRTQVAILPNQQTSWLFWKLVAASVLSYAGSLDAAHCSLLEAEGRMKLEMDNPHPQPHPCTVQFQLYAQLIASYQHVQ